MPRWLSALIVGISIGLMGVLFTLTAAGAAFEQNLGLAWLFRTRGAIEPPPEVAVIAINRYSIEGLELPPLPRDWPRSIHARLVNNLVELGASAIVFDMDFQRPKDPQQDLEFANAVSNSGRVVLFQRLEGKRQPVMDVNGQQSGMIWTERTVNPFPELADSARALAPFPVPKVQVNIFQFWSFKPSTDDSGTLPTVALQVHGMRIYERWLQVLREIDPILAEQLPESDSDIVTATDIRILMRQLRLAFTQDRLLFNKFSRAVSSLAPKSVKQADRRLMRALASLYRSENNPYLNFYGPPGTIPTIPYNAIIAGNTVATQAMPLDLTDKVVFVGYSDLFDPGQPDRFYTVFTRDDGVDLSGVEIAATAFANLLTERTLKRGGVIVTTSTLLLLGLVLGSTVFILPALIGVPLAILITAFFTASAQLSFNYTDLWLPLAIPVLLQLPFAVFIGLFSHYLLERRKEQRVSKAIRYYLPEDIAEQLTREELDVNALNKVVYGVCLATDMSGFTSISESMPPEKLALFMNSYFDALADALKSHQVDVTEFHADTIMCAWIAEDALSLERRNLALASLAVVDAVDQFTQKGHDFDLSARIGLDEGDFYLGHTGGGGRMGFSILGDCANTAARLESLNKHLGTNVLAAESIIEDLHGFQIRPVGQFALVGKSDPVSVVEIMAEKQEEDSDFPIIGSFALALHTFQNNDWLEASNQFTAILDIHTNDGPSQFYLELCRAYLLHAPEFEDLSVVHMDSK